VTRSPDDLETRNDDTKSRMPRISDVLLQHSGVGAARELPDSRLRRLASAMRTVRAVHATSKAAG
jgi:hypothetical protein